MNSCVWAICISFAFKLPAGCFWNAKRLNSVFITTAMKLVFTFLWQFASNLHIPFLGSGNKGPDDLNCFNLTRGKNTEVLIITINQISMLYMQRIHMFNVCLQH